MDKKPNILWISFEDTNPFYRCYGDKIARTPNLDNFASEGCLYTHCFSTAGVCAPARSAIITGMYPISAGTHHMRTTATLKKYLNSFLSRAIPPIYRNIERFFVQNIFDKVVIAEKYYAEFIPNGIEILNYPLAHAYPNRKYSGETEKIQLLYTGTITLDRGALICANIPNFVKNCKVSFVGRCKKKLAEKIYSKVNEEGKIEIVGVNQFVPGEVIDEFYAKDSFRAGLAIFPRSDHYFKKELTKFFEYMGAGLPIIASNFPTWKRLIEGNSCGICVDPDDTEQIASAVIYICNHPEAAKTMGENGRNAVELKYSWEREEQNLFKLYETLFSSMSKRGDLSAKGDTD